MAILEKTIELGRTFLELPDAVEKDDAGTLALALQAYGRRQSWLELLEHRYVVVLGEAGTGKTSEFRRRAALLAKGGLNAFFVEIVSLARDGLLESLDPDDEARLDTWRTSESEVTFFLDSLDEAKLQRHTLRDALRKLRRELQNEWGRVRLVISCRASDWRANADRDEVEDVIPAGGDRKAYVVQLAPLDGEQIAELAAHVGVADVSGFVRAIAEHHAQALVERPLDVEWLGTYWTEHGRLGSLRELLDHNIDEKLKEEHSERRSELSVSKARVGARALAGVAMLTKRLVFVLPDESIPVQRAQSAIKPNEVLADWTPEEIKDLLRRGLFDEATYGQVRFHHRDVQEFLAAEWLQDLREAGLPLQGLFELFFREQSGERAVPQHLGPILAWLCLWQPAIRAETIREAPALLIASGDPSGFDGKERVEILGRYAASYEGRDRLFDDYQAGSLERFASPALAEPIATLLQNREVSDELASTLYELVEHGRVRSCIPFAINAALDSKQGEHRRIAAIRAVAAVGTENQRHALLAILNAEEVLPQDVAGAFVKALYPCFLDVNRLIRVLSRTERKPRNTVTHLANVLHSHVPKHGDWEQKLQLVESLTTLICSEDENGKLALVLEHAWLLSSLARLLGVVMDESPGKSAQSPAVKNALKLFQWCSEHGPRTWSGIAEIEKAVARHPEVRRALFWQRVDEHRTIRGQAPTRCQDLRLFHHLFDLTLEDVEWLSIDAQSRTDVLEQLMAFDTLIWIRRSREESQQHMEMLRNVASSNSALGKRLERTLNRPKSRDEEEGQFARCARAREIGLQRQQERNRAALEGHIGSIRDGSNFDALHFLVIKAQESKSPSSWGDASPEPLRELFGDELADAAVQGWRAFWPKFEPQLPHEGERNQTSGGVIVGLVGIHLDFTKGELDPANLEPALVAKASRYAANELNSFPDWLESLATHHPRTVCEALEPALSADYQERDVVHDVLAKLPRAADSVRAACAPVLLDLIQVSDPPTIAALEQAIGTLLSVDGIDLASLDALVSERCQMAIEEHGRFGVWWLTWLTRNSGKALDLLESELQNSDREDASTLVLAVCQRIHEGIHGVPAFYGSDVQALARLIPIVYDYVATEDDVWHEGCFSPGARDNAQHVRSQLPNWLAEIPGNEAVEALRLIADDPRVASMRDWLLRQADARRVANAGETPSAVEVNLVELYRKHGTQARDHVGILQAPRILFLAANPANEEPLELGREAREIRQRLRDPNTLVEKFGVLPEELQKLLLHVDPTIVHFSAHGSESAELVFQSEAGGKGHLVGKDAIKEFLRILKGNIRVVVLNACHSQAQADAIAETIDFVIGMAKGIGDRAAIEFAAAFYQAIESGQSVQAAFELGKAAIRTAGLDENVETPQLQSREGLDPAKIVLFAPESGKRLGERA